MKFVPRKLVFFISKQNRSKDKIVQSNLFDNRKPKSFSINLIQAMRKMVKTRPPTSDQL